MIKAINKDGLISQFSERVWAMMAPHKNGFVELKDGEPTIIPDQIIEFRAKLAKQVVSERPPMVEVAKDRTDAVAEMDIMREYLKDHGVKFHHLLGYDKLKAIYDANKK